ncbi:hypothetical protein SAMN05216359_102152 [Roseateles sp. YR242]|uniref:hypothetical protein n=1 Tax=Roseateles sp. YR242 TaxID=1855305 RepID=UPI0008B8BCAA|nr:hypothetical protein [Roseateles sp. YR242]SEK54398.1 hypothetical protein SAMN05216359_102152 [Roseateles sp. YR242]
MTRLQAEFDRLYAPLVAERPGATGQALNLVGPGGEVRALVLDIGRPVNWELVGPVWRAVQEDLAWPAPAIAISGTQGFQLWFSLAKAVSAREGHTFLEALRRRYLSELAAARVWVFPHPGEDAPAGAGAGTDAGAGTERGAAWLHAPAVPSLVSADQWSAFVAPGLAPVFAQTPWLDFPPNEEGQADLLRGLESVPEAAWLDANKRLSVAASGHAAVWPAVHGLNEAAVVPAGAPLPAVSGVLAPLETSASTNLLQDPRSFLLQVMNDERVALPLRIDAAKALLPYTAELRPSE